MTLPNVYEPAEVAEWFGISERTVREKARRLGAYHKFGKRMVLMDDDIAALRRDAKCPIGSTDDTASGISTPPFPANAYGDLQRQRIAKPQRRSRQQPKHRRDKVVTLHGND